MHEKKEETCTNTNISQISSPFQQHNVNRVLRLIVQSLIVLQRTFHKNQHQEENIKVSVIAQMVSTFKDGDKASFNLEALSASATTMVYKCLVPLILNLVSLYFLPLALTFGLTLMLQLVTSLLLDNSMNSLISLISRYKKKNKQLVKPSIAGKFDKSLRSHHILQTGHLIT